MASSRAFPSGNKFHVDLPGDITFVGLQDDILNVQSEAVVCSKDQRVETSVKDKIGHDNWKKAVNMFSSFYGTVLFPWKIYSLSFKHLPDPKFEMVYTVSLPIYNSSVGTDSKWLDEYEKLMIELLKKAGKDKLSSISFTLLGTSVGAPVDKCIERFKSALKSVKNFNTLSYVKMVVYKDGHYAKLKEIMMDGTKSREKRNNNMANSSSSSKNLGSNGKPTYSDVAKNGGSTSRSASQTASNRRNYSSGVKIATVMIIRDASGTSLDPKDQKKTTSPKKQRNDSRDGKQISKRLSNDSYIDKKKSGRYGYHDDDSDELTDIEGMVAQRFQDSCKRKFCFECQEHLIRSEKEQGVCRDCEQINQETSRNSSRDYDRVSREIDDKLDKGRCYHCFCPMFVKNPLLCGHMVCNKCFSGNKPCPNSDVNGSLSSSNNGDKIRPVSLSTYTRQVTCDHCRRSPATKTHRCGHTVCFNCAQQACPFQNSSSKQPYTPGYTMCIVCHKPMFQRFSLRCGHIVCISCQEKSCPYPDCLERKKDGGSDERYDLTENEQLLTSSKRADVTRQEQQKDMTNTDHVYGHLDSLTGKNLELETNSGRYRTIGGASNSKECRKCSTPLIYSLELERGICNYCYAIRCRKCSSPMMSTSEIERGICKPCCEEHSSKSVTETEKNKAVQDFTNNSEVTHLTCLDCKAELTTQKGKDTGLCKTCRKSWNGFLVKNVKQNVKAEDVKKSDPVNTGRCQNCFKVMGIEIRYECGHIICRKCDKEFDSDTCIICIEPIEKHPESKSSSSEQTPVDATDTQSKNDFCPSYIDTSFKQYIKPSCPSFGMSYGIITGNMPPGTMQVTKSAAKIEGYESEAEHLKSSTSLLEEDMKLNVKDKDSHDVKKSDPVNTGRCPNCFKIMSIEIRYKCGHIVCIECDLKCDTNDCIICHTD